MCICRINEDYLLTHSQSLTHMSSTAIMTNQAAVNVLKDTRVTSNPAPTHKDLPLWAVYTMKQFLRNFAISYCRIMKRNQLLSTAFQSTLNSSFVSYRMTAAMLLFVDVVGVRLRREGRDMDHGRDMDTYIIVAII